MKVKKHTYNPFRFAGILRPAGWLRNKSLKNLKAKNMKAQEIYFAGGCFWGTEHFFKQVAGVLETEVGYANGKEDRSPTYEEVCTDQTGFAETVRVVFDADVCHVKFLTEMYFHAIDPLSLNRQGHDEGTQYRTGVYYTDDTLLPTLQSVFREVENSLGQTLAVELLPLRNFFPAEDYHQDYLDKNPQGYCHLPTELFRWAREQKANKRNKI
ncbi:MAG: peptide-methionine (S)-S-oxide reductase MsrA [Alloprevotella sp.]|nr:peptide-methionine (S)-S-oxide reductase MsrA [Alloprevotella sp.]